jgi:mercuric ion transport protein
MSMIKSTGWFLVALVTCPCHILLLFPLLAGTALGAYLSEYKTLTFAILGLLFVYSLYMGLKKMNQDEKQ